MLLGLRVVAFAYKTNHYMHHLNAMELYTV